MSDQWQERHRPPRLEKRYEFTDYASLRDFLDRAAVLSEREGLYPDMGFGRDYVNMTIMSPRTAKRCCSRRIESWSESTSTVRPLATTPQNG